MERKVYSVSEVNDYIKSLLNTDFLLRTIIIKGELTSFKYHETTGNIYFSLSDKNDSKINCVLYKSNLIYNDINLVDLTEGMELRVTGSFDVNKKMSQYQLVVTSVLPEGIAENYEQFLIMKSKLEKLGYFDIRRKKKFENIKKIGIVTSTSGAAIKDFIKIINRRYIFSEIYVYNSLVQGKNAVTSICNGINYFNEKKIVDCIVIARGGGSKEDLFVFNAEEIAHAIFNSTLPVLSAIGHEIDNTICDFVADKRVATPSEAAEFLSSEFVKYLDFLENFGNISKKIITDKIRMYDNELSYFSPKKLKNNIMLKINLMNNEISQSLNTIKNKVENDVNIYNNKIEYSIRILENINPKNLLEKGYVIVEDEESNILDTSDKIIEKEYVYLLIGNNRIKVRVLE